jgi:uncharacterized Zn finger protein
LEQKREYAVLTQVYLHDEEWDAAWEMLERASQQSSRPIWGWGSTLDLEVAQKSQHARPQRAIPVFVKYARQEIAAKNRQHYAQAAVYLTWVRDLYREINEDESWQKLIASIRAEYPKLRALQDELNQAGL